MFPELGGESSKGEGDPFFLGFIYIRFLSQMKGGRKESKRGHSGVNLKKKYIFCKKTEAEGMGTSQILGSSENPLQ